MLELFVQRNVNRCKLEERKEGSKNGADWEKYMKEGKVRIGL
jgi:hypothetical protein